MDIQGLKQYVDTLVKRGSTQGEIARKCGISGTTLSQILSGKYAAKEDNMAAKIAAALNYYEGAWNVVETVSSYQQIKAAFNAAKRNSKWFCISSRSGSGKTQSLIDLLTKLATCLGLKVTRYMDNDDLLDIIIANINQMADLHPLLILDDAGKLTHSALCALIPLYDDTFHRMGALVAGTETLERTIKRYVGRIEGYDEIDGRFKRNYIALLGATKKDVCAICQANGVTDKDKQLEIWGKLDKRKKEPVEGSGKFVLFCDDLRELAGMIDNELIHQQLERGELA